MPEHQHIIAPTKTRRNFIGSAALSLAGGSLLAALSRSANGVNQSDATDSSAPCNDVKPPMQETQGKVAFITGGASGIGLGIARAFVEAGMDVAIGYRKDTEAKSSLELLQRPDRRVHAIRVDVTDRAAMERAADEVARVLGKVHVLVNNAGVAPSSTLKATRYELWDWTLAVNVTGPFNGVHAFLPLIQSHGEGGQIITTSSVLGLFATPGAAAYTISKYAVVGMMEALRAELSGTNVGASVLCPGLVKTDILQSSLHARPDNSGFEVNKESLKRDQQLRSNPDLAMDPVEVGRLVVRGMRNNDLYIFTHPEFESIIRDRSDSLIAAIPADVVPTKERVTNAQSARHKSIYAADLDRRRCARKQ